MTDESADSATIPARTNSDKGKVRLLTLDSLDGRTRSARLAKSLVETIEDDLGGSDRLSIAERQLVQRAAVLGAILESQEAAWLAGDGIDFNTYLPALNAQRRVMESLGLQRRQHDVTPSLSDYLRGKGGDA